MTQRSENGLVLVELLVATLLTLVVAAAVLGVTNSARDAASAQMERADMEQRLRLATQALAGDLEKAGAGAMNAGPGRALSFVLAPVVPYRVLKTGGDPPGIFRSDAVTVTWVPEGAPQATLQTPISPASLRLNVLPEGCPPGAVLCGFKAGTMLLAHDAQGRFDTFMLEAVDSGEGRLSVSTPGGVLQRTYGAGAWVVPVIRRVYFVKNNGGTPQLVFNDGPGGDTPVADHVVALGLEYYADPLPPVKTRPLAEVPGPWTTYGPVPPPVGSEAGEYLPGENCVFAADAATGLHVPRLPPLGDGQSHRPLIRLTAVQLADGSPACPDATAESRFDADLLRIRKVVLTLRVEASLEWLRGPAGVQFARAGTALDARRWLPDREVRLQVTPPNLNLRP